MSAIPPKANGVTYRYEAIIDYMLAHPHLKRYEIAEQLGYTGAWFSTLTSSDAFRVLYAKRRGDYSAEFHESTVEKVYEVAQLAADRLKERLEEDDVPAGLALDSMTGSLKALGFGAPPSQPTTQVNIQQNTYNEADREALAAARRRLDDVSRLTIDGQVEPPALEGS